MPASLDILLDVRVVPRSARAGVAGLRDGALLVRLHAPPVEGAANAELIELIAETLGVPRRQVTIVAGERSRLKRVRVDGVTIDEVKARCLPTS
ncbi:MAG: DUF167 domain-containing protein [Acidobacteria bacterium]|nr:DUF167 domain-containing protein [Acidobacteriota bacterium]